MHSAAAAWSSSEAHEKTSGDTPKRAAVRTKRTARKPITASSIDRHAEKNRAALGANARCWHLWNMQDSREQFGLPADLHWPLPFSRSREQKPSLTIKAKNFPKEDLVDVVRCARP